MEFNKVKVSNRNIKVIRGDDLKPEDIKGGDVFATLYPNIGIVAKKKSGKTTVIGNILSIIMGKYTDLFVFSPTAKKDKTWIEYLKKFDTQHREVSVNSDINEIDDATGYRENLVDKFIKSQIEDKAEEEEEDIPAMPPKLIRQSGYQNRIVQTAPVRPVEVKSVNTLDEVEKQPKRKKAYPDYVLVFDDLGNTMRDNSIEQLVKKNRHFKMTTIISVQSDTDMKPSTWKNLDYLIVFADIPYDNLEKIKNICSISMEMDDFWQLYQDATKEKFSFLFIDIAREEFRCKFKHKYDFEA